MYISFSGPKETFEDAKGVIRKRKSIVKGTRTNIQILVQIKLHRN